mmetsp:Transcript_12903/g.31011  ORF Transcript_12903/g.31011 Transcript_12903/m.31011 type:complete len:209 (-) Transcript_12903:891-1517(-)
MPHCRKAPEHIAHRLRLQARPLRQGLLGQPVEAGPVSVPQGGQGPHRVGDVVAGHLRGEAEDEGAGGFQEPLVAVLQGGGCPEERGQILGRHPPAPPHHSVGHSLQESLMRYPRRGKGPHQIHQSRHGQSPGPSGGTLRDGHEKPGVLLGLAPGFEGPYDVGELLGVELVELGDGGGGDGCEEVVGGVVDCGKGPGDIGEVLGVEGMQ